MNRNTAGTYNHVELLCLRFLFRRPTMAHSEMNCEKDGNLLKLYCVLPQWLELLDLKKNHKNCNYSVTE